MAFRIAASKQGDYVELKAKVTHPNETGLRKDKDKVIPAHHIQELTVELNGKPVVLCHFGPALSADPLLVFRFSAAKVKSGDKLKMTWKDNKNGSDSSEATVKD